MSRMLKELKNLTPWQWDKKGAAPGEKSLRDFEKLEEVLYGTAASKTRREQGSKDATPSGSRGAQADSQTPATPFNATTQPRPNGHSAGRGMKRRASANETPTAHLMSPPPVGPRSAQTCKAPRTSSHTPGGCSMPPPRPSPASAPAQQAVARTAPLEPLAVAATPGPGAAGAQRHSVRPAANPAVVAGLAAPTVEGTPAPRLKGVQTPGPTAHDASPAPMLLASTGGPASAAGPRMDMQPAASGVAAADPSPSVVTALQLANLHVGSMRKAPGQVGGLPQPRAMPPPPQPQLDRPAAAAAGSMPPPMQASKELHDQAAAVPCFGLQPAVASAAAPQVLLSDCMGSVVPATASCGATYTSSEGPQPTASPALAAMQLEAADTMVAAAAFQAPAVTLPAHLPHPAAGVTEPCMPHAAALPKSTLPSAAAAAPQPQLNSSIPAVQAVTLPGPSSSMQPPSGASALAAGASAGHSSPVTASGTQAASMDEDLTCVEAAQCLMDLLLQPAKQGQQNSQHEAANEVPTAAAPAEAMCVGASTAHDASGKELRAGETAAAAAAAAPLATPATIAATITGDAAPDGSTAAGSACQQPRVVQVIPLQDWALAGAPAAARQLTPSSSMDVDIAPAPIVPPSALQPACPTACAAVVGAAGPPAPVAAAGVQQQQEAVAMQQPEQPGVAPSTMAPMAILAPPPPPIAAPGRSKQRGKSSREKVAAAAASSSAVASGTMQAAAGGVGAKGQAGSRSMPRKQSQHKASGAALGGLGSPRHSSMPHTTGSMSAAQHMASLPQPNMSFGPLGHAPLGPAPLMLPHPGNMGDQGLLAPPFGTQPLHACAPGMGAPCMGAPGGSTLLTSLLIQQQQQQHMLGGPDMPFMCAGPIQGATAAAHAAGVSMGHAGLPCMGMPCGMDIDMCTPSSLANPGAVTPPPVGMAVPPAMQLAACMPSAAAYMQQPLPAMHEGLPIIGAMPPSGLMLPLPSAAPLPAPVPALMPHFNGVLEAGLPLPTAGGAHADGGCAGNVWGPADCPLTQAVASLCQAAGMPPTPANVGQVHGLVAMLRELQPPMVQQVLQQLQQQMMAGLPPQQSGNSSSCSSSQQDSGSPANGSSSSGTCSDGLCIAPLQLPTSKPALDAEWAAKLDPSIVALYTSLLEGHRALRDAAAAAAATAATATPTIAKVAPQPFGAGPARSTANGSTPPSRPPSHITVPPAIPLSSISPTTAAQLASSNGLAPGKGGAAPLVNAVPALRCVDTNQVWPPGSGARKLMPPGGAAAAAQREKEQPNGQGLRPTAAPTPGMAPCLSLLPLQPQPPLAVAAPRAADAGGFPGFMPPCVSPCSQLLCGEAMASGMGMAGAGQLPSMAGPNAGVVGVTLPCFATGP